MRVWFVAFVPPGEGGGVLQNVRSCARELERTGMEVTCLFMPRGWGGKNYIFFAAWVFVKLLISRRRPHWCIARSSDAFFCALLRPLCFPAVKIALHNHGWERRVGEIAARLPGRQTNRFGSMRSRLVRYPLCEATLKRADLCLCGTHNEIRWMADRYPGITCCLVPNGVVTPRIPAHREPPGSSLSLLTVGPATWRKNLAYAVRVYGALHAAGRSVRLTCVGADTAFAPLADLDESARANVDCRRPETFAGMARLYADHDALLFTSWYEGGHPLVVLEALAAGCLVFGVPVPALREVIVPKKNGCFINGTVAVQDARTIIEVWDAPSQWQKIVHEGHRTAGHHSWERSVQGVLWHLTGKEMQ